MSTPTITTIRTERIVCPKCETVQNASVEHVKGAFWLSYVHRCVNCQYVILESEWQTVKETEA